MRRAVVASVLATAGCDQGAKPAPKRDEQVVTPTGGGRPDPAPDPLPVAPQVAYSNGFSLEVVDEADKPIANLHLNVTVGHGGSNAADPGRSAEVTTSELGTAYITARVEGNETVSVEAPGYGRAQGWFDGEISWMRVVMKKQRKAKR